MVLRFGVISNLFLFLDNYNYAVIFYFLTIFNYFFYFWVNIIFLICYFSLKCLLCLFLLSFKFTASVSLKKFQPDKLACAYNHSTQEVEADDSM